VAIFADGVRIVPAAVAATRCEKAATTRTLRLADPVELSIGTDQLGVGKHTLSVVAYDSACVSGRVLASVAIEVLPKWLITAPAHGRLNRCAVPCRAVHCGSRQCAERHATAFAAL
jgi:hypothetical protein